MRMRIHSRHLIHPSSTILTRSTDEGLYRDHVTELNNQRPKQPFFFLKPASSILPPGAGPVIRPKGVDLHYEVELALIMGKQVKNLEASDEKAAYDSIESKLPLDHSMADVNGSRLCAQYRHDSS